MPDDKELMDKIIELSPYSTIPNTSECQEIFDYVKSLIKNKKMTIGSKQIYFTHTAVNKDAHLFIDNDHDPELCPECIKPGTLSFEFSIE